MVWVTNRLILSEGHFSKDRPQHISTQSSQSSRLVPGCLQTPPEAKFVCSEWPDGMAWAGNHPTPCPAHPDQGSLLESQHHERRNSALRVAMSHLAPLSQSLCSQMWNRKNPLTLRSQRVSTGQYWEISIDKIPRKDRDLLWQQSWWKPQESLNSLLLSGLSLWLSEGCGLPNEKSEEETPGSVLPVTDTCMI